MKLIVLLLRLWFRRLLGIRDQRTGRLQREIDQLNRRRLT